jgi:hypothetical protein
MLGLNPPSSRNCHCHHLRKKIMKTLGDILPLLAVVAFTLLYWASQRLKVAAQPLRLEFAEKSEALLASPTLPLHLADFVRSLQKMAFGSRGMLIFSAFAVPCVALAILVHPQLIESSGKRFWIENAATRAQLYEVNRLHDRIMFLNNPLLLLLVGLEMITLVAPAILLHAIFEGDVILRVNQDVARNYLEEKSIMLRSKMPKFSFAHHQGAH